MVNKKSPRYKFQSAWSWPEEIEKKIESLIEICDDPLHQHTLHVCAGSSRLGDVQLDLYHPPKWNKLFVRADMFRTPFKPGAFDTVICDPPWELPYHVRHYLLFELRDNVKIGGRLIFNCIWFPKTPGLIVDETIYVGVPHAYLRNASLLITARRVFDERVPTDRGDARIARIWGII